MFSLLYLLSVVEAGWMFGFVFPWVQCVGSVLRFGCHVVSSCFFGETLLRDITGKALLSSALQSLNSLLRDVTALARSWTSSDGWFPRRASSGPARVGRRSCESGKHSFEEFQRVQRFKRCSRGQERERAHGHVVFNCPVFGHRPQVAGPIRASVRGGAPPMSKLSGVDVHVIQYFIHSVEDTNLQIIYMFSNT